jgi:uncharacterized protein (DUF1697 family)
VQTFVALMRGINVGSTRKLPMAELRALSIKLGLQRPETYIQSGNLIVDADIEADEVRDLLEKAIAKRFSLRVDIIVRQASQWNRYMTANPFANDAATMPKMLHLYLSRDPLKASAAKELERKAQAGSAWPRPVARFGSTMARTAQASPNSPRFLSTKLAARPRPAATGTAS